MNKAKYRAECEAMSAYELSEEYEFQIKEGKSGYLVRTLIIQDVAVEKFGGIKSSGDKVFGKFTR